MAAIGPARPRGTADENQPFSVGHLGIAYVNSKHEAEVEALRLAAHGLPVVIVNPSFVLGPDDPRGTSMELVRRFLLGRIPAYVDGGLNIVDVRDVAAGPPARRREGRDRASATSSPAATSRSTGSSPTSPGSRAANAPR